MTLDYDRLRAHEFPVVEHTYTARDCMLYALSVGFGRDADPSDLPFVFEPGFGFEQCVMLLQS